MKINSLEFCLGTGQVVFGLAPNDDGRMYNPMLVEEDPDLQIQVWFEDVDELVAKNAFIRSNLWFNEAVIATNKFIKNPYDCDFSEAERDIIRRLAKFAIKKFYKCLDSDATDISNWVNTVETPIRHYHTEEMEM